MSKPVPIRIVVGVVFDRRGRLLVVRKRGTGMFQQPGGKPDPADQDELATLARELSEELGCLMRREGARWLGWLGAPAAHEPGRLVEASVYQVQVDGPLAVQAEIEELRWIEPTERTLPLAPLTRDKILPLLLR